MCRSPPALQNRIVVLTKSTQSQHCLVMCPTTQPTMAVMIIFVAYESTVYMALQHVTKVFVKVTLLFLLYVYTVCTMCNNHGRLDWSGTI